MQMAVTGCEKTYFVVWTPHGKVIDTVTFDNELGFYARKVHTILYGFLFKKKLNGFSKEFLENFLPHVNCHVERFCEKLSI